MKLLFIADIFGRPARNLVRKILPEMINDLGVDFTIANCENASSGFGLTKKNYDELIESGIDYFTSGNHIWDKQDIIPFLDDKKINILRPINYPKNVPGRGITEVEILGQKLVLINAMGRVFTGLNLEDPLTTVETIAKKYVGATIIVDFHAEATSEKYALLKYLDGQVAAILGTHTHIQTADNQITESGTAYISDVGMVGVVDSIIGAKKESIIHSFLTQLPLKVEVPTGDVVFNAVVIDIDRNNKATSIERIYKIYKNP